MKTIRQWLEELPEPYRSEALENAEKEDSTDNLNTLDEVKKHNMPTALSGAFVWSDTPQGHEYWDSFHASL